MESSSTTEENSFFNYTNISITVQGIDRSDLFETPYFNAEKTILTLEPKRDSLISFISETMHTPFIDFIITFPETLPSKNSAQASTLKNPSFTVRYKAESETTPPARYAFFATRHEISLETAATLDTDKMFTEDKEFVSHGNTSDYKDYTDSVLQNRTRGTVYLYGRYYDSESGIKSITVTEKRIYTASTTGRLENAPFF